MFIIKINGETETGFDYEKPARDFFLKLIARAPLGTTVSIVSHGKTVETFTLQKATR